MPTWLVRLAGDKFDLEDLPSVLHSPKHTVIEEDGLYYLTSSDFDSLSSADEVRGRAITIIRMLNDVMKLHSPSFRDISEDCVTLIDDDGRRHNYLYLQASVSVRSKARANLTVARSNGSAEIGSSSSGVESSLDLAESHEVVPEALHFFREDTWFGLYKVYEIVSEDVGGHRMIVRNGWATKQELNRFSQTAQSKAALGDFARHAASRYKPPSQPMTFEEARALVRRFVLGWLTSKA